MWFPHTTGDRAAGDGTAAAAVPLPAEDDFPAGGTDDEKLRFLLGYAVLAPSGHNTQPWAFALDGRGGLEAYADPERALPVLDPDRREQVMSCGAALYHLRAAARYFGLAPRVHPLPDPDDPSYLARVTLAPGDPPDLGERTLFRAIPHRHTSWRAFERAAPPPGLMADLRAAAAAEGAWLEPLSDDPDRRAALRALLREADAELVRSGAFRDEMAGWLGGATAGAGVPGYPPEVGGQVAYSGPLESAVDPGAVLAGHTVRVAEQAPLVAVLGTPGGDGPAAWLAAGQALDRALLRAAADDVSASYLSGPLQVASLRPRLASLLATPGAPQLVLAFGYARGPREPSPRRPVADVLRAPRPARGAEPPAAGRPETT